MANDCLSGSSLLEVHESAAPPRSDIIKNIRTVAQAVERYKIDVAYGGIHNDNTQIIKIVIHAAYVNNFNKIIYKIHRGNHA